MSGLAIRRRQALVLAGLVAFPLVRIGPLAAAPDPADATAFVGLAGEKVLAVLRDGSLSDEAKLERLIEILDGPIDLERATASRDCPSGTGEPRGSRA